MAGKQRVTAAHVEREKNQAEKKRLYNEYVKQKTPRTNRLLNLLKAYLVGGLICILGQLFTDYFTGNGVEKELAASYTTLLLVLLAVLATGFNLYQKLANFAGAGSVVPITGFANSVAAPAIEYKKEGQVFGIGCKIFTIAGPVILYGIFCSWILGVIYYIWTLI